MVLSPTVTSLAEPLTSFLEKLSDTDWVILGFLTLILIAVAFLFWKIPKRGGIARLSRLHDQLQDLSIVIDHKLSETQQSMRAQLETSTNLITNVTKQLTHIEETNKEIASYSAQLQQLQNILQIENYNKLMEARDDQERAQRIKNLDQDMKNRIREAAEAATVKTTEGGTVINRGNGYESVGGTLQGIRDGLHNWAIFTLPAAAIILAVILLY